MVCFPGLPQMLQCRLPLSGETPSFPVCPCIFFQEFSYQQPFTTINPLAGYTGSLGHRNGSPGCHHEGRNIHIQRPANADTSGFSAWQHDFSTASAHDDLSQPGAGSYVMADGGSDGAWIWILHQSPFVEHCKRRSFRSNLPKVIQVAVKLHEAHTPEKCRVSTTR